MTSLNIKESDIPDLEGKKVIITGASSGIGLEAAGIFAEKGASVLNLDINPPNVIVHDNIKYRKCDISKWEELLASFKHAGDVHIAVANAGVSEETDYFADTFDQETGELLEPTYGVLGVNLHGVFNFTKLALSSFRRRKYPGSIVITSSATAYSPEHSLPVYSASKLAANAKSPQLIGLVRALRSTVRLEGITINSVAPAATITALLPKHLAAPIVAAGLPVSSARFVGLALVYSAVAKQDGLVELYGKDGEGLSKQESRWNGRTILTLGDQYTELEGPLSALRPQWFGATNMDLTRLQQTATDFRESKRLT